MELNYSNLLNEKIELINSTKSLSKLKLRDKFKNEDWFFNFDKLPNNWQSVNILDVTWLVTCGVAKKPEYVDEGIPFLSAQNARPFKANLNKIKYITPEQFETLTVGGKPELNDVLYTRVGNCGEAAKVIFDFDFAVYVSLTLIKPIHELINTDYLVAFLNSHNGLTQANVGAIGSGLKNLNVNNVRKYKIPLPPLSEQQRIVAKLDVLFNHLEGVKTRLNNIPILLKNFRQAILTQAVTGKLTEEWRVGKELGEWGSTNLESIILNIQAGKNFKCPEYPVSENKVGLVKISAVTWGSFDEKETKTVEDQEKINENYFIKKGDFLISRANTIELVGSSVIVDKINYNIMISDKVWRVNFKNDINKKYVNHFVKSQIGRNEIETRSSGNQDSMRNLSQKNFKAIKVNLPSLKEQTEIVKRVESLFAKADAIEANYQTLKTKMANLPQAILAKAFKGELVEQLDTDGDAKDLLEEIKRLKEAEEAMKKKVKKRKK